jgi:RNA-splicing ligase RtcB
VGVGSEGSLTLRAAEMDRLLSEGMAYVQELGLCWLEDREVTEETVSVCAYAETPCICS